MNVIDVPLWARTLLVKGIILNTRPKASAKAYKKFVGRRFSLIVPSESLKSKVADKIDYPVALAMRYGSMSLKKALRNWYHRC